MDRLDGGKFQRLGGAAGAHSAHKAGAGALGPRPCFGFAGPSGPQNAAAPRRNPTTPAYPRASAPPPALGRLPGSAGRMGRTCGGRRRSGAGAKGPGPRTCPLPGKPGSGRVGVAHPPPPPSAGFSTNAKKRNAKSQAFRPTQPRPVHRPEKGGSDREPLRGRLQPSRRKGASPTGAATE